MFYHCSSLHLAMDAMRIMEQAQEERDRHENRNAYLALFFILLHSSFNSLVEVIGRSGNNALILVVTSFHAACLRLFA